MGLNPAVGGENPASGISPDVCDAMTFGRGGLHTDLGAFIGSPGEFNAWELQFLKTISISNINICYNKGQTVA
jgi:hypothetical protein